MKFCCSIANNPLIEQVRSLNLKLGDYAVIGGAVMAVHGIRENGDIDVLVKESVYEDLKSQGWEEKIISPEGKCVDFSVLEKGDYEVFTLIGFDPKIYNCNIDYSFDNEALIHNADIIDGVPFVRLEDLRMFKVIYNREKDVKDVELIDKHLNISGIFQYSNLDIDDIDIVSV